jgi:hypothetical protein
MSTLLNHPRIVSISDPCGCSLTKASVIALTPDRIEAMGDIEYNMEAIFARIQEARTVGVVPNTLYDLLMSRISHADKGQLHKKTVGRQSIIAPFKYRRRERNLISSYFNVTGGAANANAGNTVDSVVYPTSAWDLSIDTGPGQFKSELKNLARYFLPGNYIVVEHLSGSNAAYTTAHKIITAVDASETVATVTVSAPFTAAGWAALDAGEKAPFQPESGAVQLMSNNVSDYESWCYNQPTNLSNELIVDWFQTSRFTRCRNKEYEDMLRRIMDGEVNQWLKNFQHLDPAKRNKLEFIEHEKQWMNSVWFNQRLNEFQTADPTWDDIEALDQVVDPEDPSCVYEIKANALGIKTQLGENGRVVDMQGADLDLDMIFELAYVMRRNRQLDGKTHDTIDYLTDRKTAAQIEKVLIAYLKAEYGYDISRNVDMGKVIDSTGVVAFDYKRFDIPKQQFQIALITHPFFDDRIDAFQTASKSRGRMLVAMDWNDVNIGILETNSQKREYKGQTTANANATWSCVMKLNTKEYDLRSTTWDLEFGDFSRHQIVENFGSGCPYIDAEPCTVS